MLLEDGIGKMEGAKEKRRMSDFAYVIELITMVVVKNFIKLSWTHHTRSTPLVSSEEAGIAFPILFLPPLILLISKSSHPLDHSLISHLLTSTYLPFTNIPFASIETRYWSRASLNTSDLPEFSTSTGLY